MSSMELAERIFLGKTPDIKPAVKRKLESFVTPILALRKMASEVSFDLSISLFDAYHACLWPRGKQYLT